MIVVSDTSVVTSLIQIGRLALLQKLHGKVLIPRAVHQELLRSHQVLPEFLEVREILDHKMVDRLEAVGLGRERAHTAGIAELDLAGGRSRMREAEVHAQPAL